DHGEWITSRLAVILWTKWATQGGSNSAGVEQIAGHELALDRLANPFPTPTHERCLRIECRQQRERLIVVAEINVARITQSLVPLEGGTALEVLSPNLP